MVTLRDKLLTEFPLGAVVKYRGEPCLVIEHTHYDCLGIRYRGETLYVHADEFRHAAVSQS